MKVLVTGGSGFVGARLVRSLISEGETVRATYRTAAPADAAGAEWMRLARLDDERHLEEAVAGCDAVVHLAALAHQSDAHKRVAEFLRVNTVGTRLLARAAVNAGVRRFVFVSSIAAVCTRSDEPVNDLTAPAPTDIYGRSKLEAERALVAQMAGAACDWCILRPPLVYGPGNPGNMRRLLKIMASGWPLPLGAIRNRRSLMFVDNLNDALRTVMRHQRVVRSAFALSDGSEFSTPELVLALAGAAGVRVRLLNIPIPMLTVLGRLGDTARALSGRSLGLDSTAVDRLVGSLEVDGARFRQFFHWTPPVALDSALQQTAQALR